MVVYPDSGKHANPACRVPDGTQLGQQSGNYAEITAKPSIAQCDPLTLWLKSTKG
ncbi:MAG: hypothetical protein JKY83_11190 [Rhizobiaceae bacterium]|nr:hypothetical protein [Rhizobiaceae bacterium]